MLRRTFLFSTALATIMPSIMRDAFAQGAPDTATVGFHAELSRLGA